jgi:hypothetical protein
VKTGAVKNLVSWRKTASMESNEAAVLGAMKYCQAAVAELEAMKLRPERDAARIAALKAGIPSTDVYAEAEAERPMEKAPVGSGRAPSRLDRLLGRA